MASLKVRIRLLILYSLGTELPAKRKERNLYEHHLSWPTQAKATRSLWDKESPTQFFIYHKSCEYIPKGFTLVGGPKTFRMQTAKMAKQIAIK